jgi:hypothetical protein
MTPVAFRRRIVQALKFMAMGPAVQRVRRIQIALLISIALYAVAGEMLSRRVARDTMPRVPPDTLFHALSLISVSLVGATIVVRRTLVFPSEASLRKQPDDEAAIDRWRTGYLFLYALCEVLGLFGLILRMVGFTLANVWGFYLGGFLLLLLYSPRTPRPASRF